MQKIDNGPGSADEIRHIWEDDGAGKWPALLVGAQPPIIVQPPRRNALVNNIVILIFTVSLFVIAVVVLFFPRRIQAYAIRSWPLDHYVRSNGYLLHLRFVGFVVFVMALGMLYVFVSNFRHKP